MWCQSQCVLPGALHGSWGVQGGKLSHQRRCSTETFRWQLCSSAKVLFVSWDGDGNHWIKDIQDKRINYIRALRNIPRDNQSAQLEDWNRHKMGPFLTANCCSPAENIQGNHSWPQHVVLACLWSSASSGLRLKNQVTFGHWTQWTQ